MRFGEILSKKNSISWPILLDKKHIVVNLGHQFETQCNYPMTCKPDALDKI